MSVEDVERELERIRQGYEKSVIDITPTEISEQGAANGDEQGSGIMESFEPGIEEDEDPEN